MQGILKVQPEQLIQASSEFRTKGQRIGTLLDQMMNLVTNLTSVWEGDAGNAYITKFKGLQDDIQLVLRMVDEHSRDLNDMATEYKNAEQEAMDDISTLSSDVIV